MTLGAECKVFGFVFGYFDFFVLCIFFFFVLHWHCSSYGVTAAGAEWKGSPEHEQRDYFNVLQCTSMFNVEKVVVNVTKCSLPHFYQSFKCN